MTQFLERLVRAVEHKIFNKNGLYTKAGHIVFKVEKPIRYSNMQ